MSPPVTLIVPVRDEEASIRRVIEQLLSQKHPAHEIVIADGGSTDRTKEIVREFIGRGEPVRLVEDADAYPGRGRNLAIAAADTEWVAMTDAGTAIRPDWLGSLVRRASGNVGAVFGTYEPILDTYFRECLALAFVPTAMVVDGKPYRGPSTASMMLRRDVWDSLERFPEHLRACEDLLFFDRLAAAKVETACAPEALVSWNIPAGPRAAFRRFRLYSRHTLAAGMGRGWQLAVARMYLAGAAVAVLAVVHHWAWLLLLVVAAGARVVRTMRKRRPWLPLRHRVGPHTYLLVGLLLLWLDLAAFTGCVEYALRGRSVKLRPASPASC